jgi:GTP-binding protein
MVQVEEKLNEEEKIEAEMGGERVHIIIIGRPNAGKSTLVNQILQEERVITGEKAGITRDSISIDFTLLGKPVKLVDTAGIRKNTDKEGLEKLSIYETSRALRLGHVALLIIDATDPFVQQDLSIAGDILREGRILIVVINKSDLLTADKVEDLKHQLKETINSFIRDIVHPEFCIISAKEGTGLRALYRKIFELYEGWNTKIKTNALNNWLIQKIRLQPPPLLKGKEVRIKYISQIKIRPPTFAVFTNRKEGITDSYIRFLSNSIIKDFNLPGISVRISVRETENPYANKGKPKPKGSIQQKTIQRGKKKNNQKKSK